MNDIHKRNVINILDLLMIEGEETLLQRLSSFSCPINPEIEDFIHYKAIDFARRKLSITYLILDETAKLLGFFTLTHKALEIKGNLLSNTVRKKLSAHARFDKNDDSYSASAFLLAQIGKNYNIDKENRISGSALISDADDILKDIQHRIGGGIIYLDCEDKVALRHFYMDENHYKIFGERVSETDHTRYLQMLRFF